MPIVMPFGLSPFGFGGPPNFPPAARPPVIAAEKIDPTTRDIATMESGNDVIDAQVQIALTVLRNSGVAVADVGQRFRDVVKLTDNASVLLDNQARLALATLVERKDIAIETVGVVVDSSNTFAEVTVEYTNLRAVGDKTRQHVVRVEPSTR